MCYLLSNDPAGIYLFKVNNRNSRIRYEICSKLTIKAPERRQMVKHTQTICRQQSANCLSVFDHFVGLALEGLKQQET